MKGGEADSLDVILSCFNKKQKFFLKKAKILLKIKKVFSAPNFMFLPVKFSWRNVRGYKQSVYGLGKIRKSVRK